jgi:hypothetical protein
MGRSVNGWEWGYGTCGKRGVVVMLLPAAGVVHGDLQLEVGGSVCQGLAFDQRRVIVLRPAAAQRSRRCCSVAQRECLCERAAGRAALRAGRGLLLKPVGLLAGSWQVVKSVGCCGTGSVRAPSAYRPQPPAPHAAAAARGEGVRVSNSSTAHAGRPGAGQPAMHSHSMVATKSRSYSQHIGSSHRRRHLASRSAR